LNTLLNPNNSQVFDVVAKRRHIIMKDLVDTVDIDKAAVSESVDELQKAGLIQSEPSDLDDFKILYVTADGLQAERQYRRLASSK
jgi:DNA-binding MarR family transcriptional regulator